MNKHIEAMYELNDECTRLAKERNHLRRALEKACAFSAQSGICPSGSVNVKCFDKKTGWNIKREKDKCEDCYLQYFKELAEEKE